MIRIALPNKGRLADDARALLTDAGLAAVSLTDRALTARLGDDYEALFVRAQDIPEFVADGVVDAGITGLDLVKEAQRPVAECMDLGFGKCRLVVAVREDMVLDRVVDVEPGTRVATAFPRLTARYFAELGVEVDVVPVSGAAEIAPHAGIAPIVVDLTSTGSTLKVNGLREVATILESSARLVIPIGGVPGGPERRVRVEMLAEAMASVLRARERRYMMANVPRAALDRVKEILPGLNGPTVIDILNGGTMVAVHAVVATAAVFRTIADLKSLGAEGILVTRIERLAP